MTVCGKRITCANEWWIIRRPEILSLFKRHIYGDIPEYKISIKTKQIAYDPAALSGLATRKEITISLRGKSELPRIHILLYTPNSSIKPVPTILGLNFYGNHAVNKDPSIKIAGQWHENNPNKNLIFLDPPRKARGSDADSWPVEIILKHGYAIATAYYGDIEPDYTNGYSYGFRATFTNINKEVKKNAKNIGSNMCKTDFNKPFFDAKRDWGAIGVWAWGLCRIMDYLEKEKDVQASKVALFGHSRLGKVVLWAGALDTRFSAVIANNSGCGGAALSKRRFGETIGLLNLVRPHWFKESFKAFNGNEEQLPIDQHLLLSLIAPRPLYIASAEQDLAADPFGEFCSAKNADCVYKLLGLPGFGLSQMPAINKTVGETIGYHIRTGKHGVTVKDWDLFLDFLDKHFENKVRPRN
jgi:hypothetical protein